MGLPVQIRRSVAMDETTAPGDQLVVIGASAGGINALSDLLDALPADLPAAIVIAQHLDPSRTSHLGPILSRHTSMPVRTVEDREQLTNGTIYVIPANRHVAITDHEVYVRSDDLGEGRPIPSIDLLLTTAASVFGERLIAVILTGSGSDGAAGAHAVKEAGGTVIIQDPSTAAFPSMPRSLSPPLVDAAPPVEKIGSMLSELLADAEPGETPPGQDLSQILGQLRANRGIDFTAYKSPTIERRLRRRMATLGIGSLADYRAYLDRHPDEEQQLIAHFLIKVTRFFRDPALFAFLRDQLCPELLDAARAGQRELRVWSAGCATGEEAYSLALLLTDLQADAPRPVPVRIFATDLDDTALAFARRGFYPGSATSDMPQEMLDRYFVQQDGGYHITKEVRNVIVFGNHDLAQRPPFPHTDLILCRNVLIYSTPELQKRALDIFAYSLRNGGFLILGKTESARPVDQSFVTYEPGLRIYRREGPRNVLPPAELPIGAARSTGAPPMAARARGAIDSAAREAANNALLSHRADSRAEDLLRLLPIGAAVVNRQYDVEMINGAARDLLGVHDLALGQDLVHLARSELSRELRTVIDAAFAGGTEPPPELVVRTESSAGERRHLAISARADQPADSGTVTSALVLIQDDTALIAAQEAETQALDRLDKLSGTNRALLRANQGLTDSIDVLRAQGDELRLATAAAQVWAEEIETLNEELQSSNEELETLHEEAQATVEELNVANEELQARSVELRALAAAQAAERGRLAAVLAGMDDAVMVVDREGGMVLTNAAYDALLVRMGGALTPADDRGMPIPEDATPRMRAARGESFSLDFTARATDGARYWFDATGRPLEAEEAGAGVVVIRDITDRSVRRMQEEFLQWAGHELRTPLAALQAYLQMAIRQVGDAQETQVTKFLGSAVEQAQRMATLIEELLDASRLRAGRLQLQKGTVDLVALARHVVDVASVLSTHQEIVAESPEPSLTVEADRGRIEQVLFNLLLNAITHAPESDRIEVAVDRGDGMARIAVRDSGPGIPQDQLERFFEQFGQADRSRPAAGGGLGLGLYIAREIVRAHNGEITVVSARDAGTTVSVFLPLTSPLGARPEPA
jgi:two-component system CheB/CheR fusion protein